MKTIRIGRSSTNDVVIDDLVVSSSHAVIKVSDFGEITIEDTGSKNGTFVNGERIVKPTKLASSSTVLLGNHSIDWKQIVQKAAVKQEKTPVSLPTDVVDKKLIGRNPAAQIRFSYDDVSDKHAYLCKRSDGSVLIIDNNSTNGTYVNGVKIMAPRKLNKGDNISLANRHPLNWEAVYPPRMAFDWKTIAAVAAAILLLVGIFALKPWESFGKNWTKVYADHKNDVVLIYVKSAYAVTAGGYPLSTFLSGNSQLDYCYVDSDGDVSSGIATSSGTGFFISPDGKFLTNRHVVGSAASERENEEKVRRAIQSVLVQNGMSKIAALVEVNYKVMSLGIVQNDTFINSESDLIPCTILKVSDNEELDVALLQTNSKTLPGGSTYVDLSKAVPSEKLSIGDGICTIGFPKSFIIGQTSSGLEANNQSGEITQERGQYEYGHNITIHQGASGSPVYDRRGRFAGIIVSGFLGISQGYNHAIQPTPVLDFVKQSL